MTGRDDEIVQLLRDIRSGQQEHLALYRDVVQRSLDTQQLSVDLQRRSARLYRVVVSVAAVLVAGLLYYLHSLSN
ncbi:hypothetical protein [Dokdonella ginsengisoli]|uniref:Uncharacterized protein n=1 Tax=Dokdonella ginsengisoli TaxID=363846 RepID=A0ABV9R0V1_9GAMM